VGRAHQSSRSLPKHSCCGTTAVGASRFRAGSSWLRWKRRPPLTQKRMSNLPDPACRSLPHRAKSRRRFDWLLTTRAPRNPVSVRMNTAVCVIGVRSSNSRVAARSDGPRLIIDLILCERGRRKRGRDQQKKAAANGPAPTHPTSLSSAPRNEEHGEIIPNLATKLGVKQRRPTARSCRRAGNVRSLT
jgi:hypothetical protein